MLTNSINRSDVSFDNLTKSSNGKSQKSFFEELFGGADSSQMAFLERLLSDNQSNEIFEHYADFDQANWKFLLGDVSSLLNQVKSYIEELKSTISGSTEFLSNAETYFSKMFDKIDKLYGTNLSKMFDGFMSKLNTENIDQNLTKDEIIDKSFSMLKKTFEKMQEQQKYESNNANLNFSDRFHIDYLLEKLANIDNSKLKLNGGYYSNQINDLAGEDSDNIIRHLTLNGEEQSSSNPKEAIKEFSFDDYSEILYKKGQSGESYNQQEFDSSKFGNNILSMNNNILRNIAGKSNFEQSLANEQIAEKQVFKQVRIADLGRVMNGFVRNVPQNGESSARLMLEPNWLGTVIVEVKMKDSIADVKIKVSSKDAMNAVENQISTLKEKLGTFGINANKIDISFEENTGNEFANLQNGSNSEKEKRDFINTFKNTNEKFEIKEELEENDIIRFNTGNIIEKYV